MLLSNLNNELGWSFFCCPILVNSQNSFVRSFIYAEFRLLIDGLGLLAQYLFIELYYEERLTIAPIRSINVYDCRYQTMSISVSECFASPQTITIQWNLRSLSN